MVQATEYLYIVRDDEILRGEPIIKGTHTPVRAIVETWRLGVAPEEIPLGMPHLTLSQVFSALTYYSDHLEEILEMARDAAEKARSMCEVITENSKKWRERAERINRTGSR